MPMQDIGSGRHGTGPPGTIMHRADFDDAQ
jgi:hypothetical protein